MSLEFDHLFICTGAGAPEIDVLLKLGLVEGTSNVHPGQGTANRRIFFHNAMLELLWVVDTSEVCSPLISPTHLWERSQYLQTGFSPFGVAFRQQHQENQGTALPFATWAYHPPYLPPHLQIDVACDTVPSEPMLFVIPFSSRPDQQPPDRQQPHHHPVGWREITKVTISLPATKPHSAAIQAVQDSELLRFQNGDIHRVDLEFDGATQGQEVDLRPRLPLGVRW